MPSLPSAAQLGRCRAWPAVYEKTWSSDDSSFTRRSGAPGHFFRGPRQRESAKAKGSVCSTRNAKIALRHKRFGCGRRGAGRAQHGHRDKVRTRAKTSRERMVAIEPWMDRPPHQVTSPRQLASPLRFGRFTEPFRARRLSEQGARNSLRPDRNLFGRHAELNYRPLCRHRRERPRRTSIIRRRSSSSNPDRKVNCGSVRPAASWRLKDGGGNGEF